MPEPFFFKANILVDQNRHARLADFGLLTVVSDPTNTTATNSFSIAGTTRWMSPELLDPNQFGSENTRPTKESDSYALGMVILEVLSGRAPFAPYNEFMVMRLVTEGKHPERPKGSEGVWFTDDLWRMLNLCWDIRPESRPGIGVILEDLERASSDWNPLSPQVSEDAEIDEAHEGGWDFTTTPVSNSAGVVHSPDPCRGLHADCVSNLLSGPI